VLEGSERVRRREPLVSLAAPLTTREHPDVERREEAETPVSSCQTCQRWLMRLPLPAHVRHLRTGRATYGATYVWSWDGLTEPDSRDTVKRKVIHEYR
jgi:hypothetical protein